MTEILLSKSFRETLELGRKFAARMDQGAIVGLMGPLGAGKTCFVKGVISHLTGIDPEEITSPSFTMVEEYSHQPRIYHVDLFRISTPGQAEELPWDELLQPQRIVLIEWPENVAGLLGHCQYQVKFSKEGIGERKIEIGVGSPYGL